MRKLAKPGVSASLTGQPTNMARWAQAVEWIDNEPGAQPTMKYINDGDPSTSWNSIRKKGDHLFGLRWEEPRRIRRIAIRWAGIPPDPSQCRLEHLYWSDIEIGMFNENYGIGRDWWQGDWVKFPGELTVDQNAWTFEAPESVLTLQLRLKAPGATPVSVAELEAYTDSVWQTAKVESEWGFDPAFRDKAFDGHLEAYNGYILSVKPLDPGTIITGPTSWTSRRKKAGRRGLQVELLCTLNGVRDRDRTVVTLRTKGPKVSFLPYDALQGPIYVSELGLFFCAAGRKIKASTFVKKWTDEGHKTIRQRTREAPEQSLAKARRDQRWTRGSETIIRCNRDTLPFGLFYVSADGEKVGGFDVKTFTIAPVFYIKPGTNAVRERQEWLENYLPVLTTRWHNGNLEYQQELFGTTMDDGHPVIAMGLTATNHGRKTTTAEWNLTYPGWKLGDSDVLLSADKKFPLCGYIDLRGRGELKHIDAGDSLLYQLELRASESHTIWTLIPGLCRMYEMKTGLKSSRLPHLRALVPEIEREKVISYWENIVRSAARVDLPDQAMTDAWKQGMMQLLMVAERFSNNTYDLRIGATYSSWETESVPFAQVMDMLGLADVARGGLEYLLAGQGKEKPLGRFRTKEGCICTLAPVSSEGPGFVLQAIADHFEYTRDLPWLRKVLPKIKTGCEWIIRERRLEMQATADAFPGQKMWGYGLAPPGSLGDPLDWRQMFFQNAYYYLGLLRTSEALVKVDPKFSARMAREAKQYHKAILEALDTGISLSPVIRLLNGAYSPVAPPFPHSRGLCHDVSQWGTWDGYVYDMEAGPLHVVDSRVLPPDDRRVGWMLDVLEDVICVDGKVYMKKPDFERERDWPSFSGFAGQHYYQHMATAHLKRDDIPNFLRVFFNCYVASSDPELGIFWENVAGGAPYKTHEQAWFMQQFRYMLVMESKDELQLAMGTPRAWLEDGKYIRVQKAPTFFGPVSYAIESAADSGMIRARVQLPTRNAPKAVILRLRHPEVRRMVGVEINGKPWKNFNSRRETIRITGFRGDVNIIARYRGKNLASN